MNKKRDKQYYELPDPYENTPSCKVNLRELARYAKKENKKISALSEDEIKLFVVQKEEK